MKAFRVVKIRKSEYVGVGNEFVSSSTLPRSLTSHVNHLGEIKTPVIGKSFGCHLTATQNYDTAKEWYDLVEGEKAILEVEIAECDLRPLPEKNLYLPTVQWSMYRTGYYAENGWPVEPSLCNSRCGVGDGCTAEGSGLWGKDTIMAEKMTLVRVIIGNSLECDADYTEYM